MRRLYTLKQGISFAINVAAALFFVFSGKAAWSVALVMAVGGAQGGRLASKIKPAGRMLYILANI
jgi:uncharacterized membrane protein YfcA